MRSIQTRLLLLLAGGSATLVLAGGWVLDGLVRRQLLAMLDAALPSRAEALAIVLALDPDAMQEGRESALAAALEVTSRPFFFQIWTHDGVTAGRSPSLAGVDLPYVHGDEPTPWFGGIERLPNGQAGRAVAVVMHQVRAVGASGGGAAARFPLTIVVATDQTELDATLARLRRVALLIVLVALGVGVLTLRWVLRSGLAPLRELAEQARGLDARSLASRFELERVPSELVPIRDRLNELLERLQAAFDHEQRFTSSLAHELRTPIAELRTLAEVALRADPAARSSGNYQAFLTSVERIQSLVQALLLLRRSEAGQLERAGDRVELGTLVQDVLDDHEASAAQRRLSIEAEIADGVWLDTNRAMLRAIVDNLLRNAVEYAPTGTAVRVDVERTGASFACRIRNAAPALDEESVARLFEPRKGGQTRRDGSHLGLGLALCNALARFVGLELAAALDPEHRLVFTIAGPARADADQRR
ncbi:MAG: hypothetical protein HZA53_14960 [Planctomycetes bacterium]|nr:hypothetical protein [Planctomycetota bacterium]